MVSPLQSYGSTNCKQKGTHIRVHEDVSTKTHTTQDDAIMYLILMYDL